MCGRYTLTKPEIIAKRFNAAIKDLELNPNYNAAPTQIMPVVRAEAARDELELMQWGLVPPWSKDGKMTFSTINARSEGLEDKPTYRTPFRKRRCIIPADGFFEWMKTEDGKQPFYIYLKDHGLYGFAGLWDSWKAPDGKELQLYHNHD